MPRSSASVPISVRSSSVVGHVQNLGEKSGSLPPSGCKRNPRANR